MTIGFIGLGVMGEPMCRNLVTKGGTPVVVHDLRPEPVERLIAAGATEAGTIAELVGHVDVVMTCLPGGPELEAVMRGEGGVLSALTTGQLVVDHSTAPLQLTRDLAEQCQAAGADYCDAPVARTRQAAIDGTLSIMVGASAETFARAEPLLELMASDVTRCGDVGAGQVTKLLNNMVLFQNVRAVAEAHAIASGLDAELGDDLGLDIDTVFGVIRDASGGSFALANHGHRSILPDTFPLEAFSTRYAMKDLSYALELAEQTGVDAIGARTVGELMAAAAEAGFDREYFPVMRRLL